MSAVLQLSFLVAGTASAQTADPGERLADSVLLHTDGRLRVGFEERFRYEFRGGNAFGRDVDVAAGLERTRVSLTFETETVKISGMMQDARAPWYGAAATGSQRDTADLQEAYIQLFPKRKTGFEMMAGRIMLNYGEGRILGSPQWSNTARTYDHAHISFRTKRARVEALIASPVKVRTDEFNRPVLGDRVWGVYSTFPETRPGVSVEAYVLRHEQNRPGGFTGGSTAEGTDRLRVNLAGFRLTGPLARGWKFSLEGVAENGRIGAGAHRAAAWYSGISRRWTAAKRPLDVSGEYKFASGARHPEDATRSRTFDQVSPANHDKFGHEDLFGWKNLHNARGLASYAVAKGLMLNLMYNHYWLASACDSLYNSAGRGIARAAGCDAGRHVGQEVDLFAVYRYRHFQTGAGYGYFVPGEFLRRTTPGAGASYVYFFHSYSL